MLQGLEHQAPRDEQLRSSGLGCDCKHAPQPTRVTQHLNTRCTDMGVICSQKLKKWGSRESDVRFPVL